MEFPDASSRLVVCIGAPKSGTSTLYDLMASHPEVSVTKFKESNYFIEDRLYSRGYNHYLNTEFAKKPSAKIFFEADPLYMYSNDGLKRIHDCSPECRIVIMLRNPVDRAFSEYLAVMRYADHTLTFPELCAQWLQKNNEERLEYQTIERSFYSNRVKKALELFPRDNIHIILFDDLCFSIRTQFFNIENWLGINHVEINDVHANPAVETRSKLLAKLLSNPRYGALRSAVRTLIPGRTPRRLFSEYLSRLNSRPYEASSKPKVDISALPAPLLEMYRNDLIELQKLLGLDLTAWIDKLSVAAEAPPQLSGGAR
jgi:hypothetical protein